MEIKILPATKDDYKDIIKLLLKLHKIHVKERPDIFKEIDCFYTKKEFRKLLKSKKKKYFVAKNYEETVGVISINLEEFNGIICPSIGNLYIKKKYRKLKIGTKLINEIKKFYLEEKKDNKNYSDFITLNVFGFNEKALNFYKKNGFIDRCRILELNIEGDNYEKNNF